jgi:hypothetical protein
MRLIRKGPEPPLFLAYRKTQGARYDSLPADAKTELRTALVRDQHGLCCFCMQRVEAAVAPELKVKIAHWMPQQVDAARALDWANLLAACPGNEGAPKDRQHCDTRQGSRPGGPPLERPEPPGCPRTSPARTSQAAGMSPDIPRQNAPRPGMSSDAAGDALYSPSISRELSPGATPPPATLGMGAAHDEHQALG